MHIIIALYTFVFSFAATLLILFVESEQLTINWLAPLLFIAAIGMFFKKGWAAHMAFGLYGLAMAFCILVGIVGFGICIIQAFSLEGFYTTAEGIIRLVIYCLLYFTAFISLFIPLKLLNTNSAKSIFGLKVKTSNNAISSRQN